MGKSVHSDVLDASHDEVINNGNLMIACSAEPTTRAEAVSTYALADVALAPGDYTKAAGDGTPTGRKTTVGAKNSVLIDTGGTANHVAIVDATRLLRVTTCDALLLVAGQNVNFPAWDFDIDGPT